MVYRYLYENYPLVQEVIDYYISLRMHGCSRDFSLDRIYEKYHQELSDTDERHFVIIAIAMALCKKKELSPRIRNDALLAVDQLRRNALEYGAENELCIYDKLTSYLSENRIGPEATYRAKKQYDPGWKTGDTFIHAFSQPSAEEIGLSGAYVVFRKVGEYLDQKGHHVQLVYVTVCSADSIPKTDADLKVLGFLRMMEHDKKWDYLGQLFFRSKKDEEQWKLEKIGCFPNAGCPNDATIENPLVCMPFFGILHRNSDILDYEDLVCHLIKLRGINRATGEGDVC